MSNSPITVVISPLITLTAGAALEENISVGLNSSGQAVVASSTVRRIGVCRSATASGDPANILLDKANGLTVAIASGAITAGADVYMDASGKISSAPTGRSEYVGVALDAATADGDNIRVFIRDDSTERKQTVTSSGTSCTIDTGFGSNPAWYQITVHQSTGVQRTGWKVAWSAGVATFDTTIASGDVVMLHSRLRLQ